MTREEQLKWLRDHLTEICKAHDTFVREYRQLPNTIYLPFLVEPGTEVLGMRSRQTGFFVTREDEEGKTSLFSGQPTANPLLSTLEERLDPENEELLEWLDGQAKLWEKLAKKKSSVLLFDTEEARVMTERVAAKLRRP